MPHRYPDTHVLYRNLGRAYPLVIKGEGCWLYDSEGRSYLDACGGAFVACLGHGLPEVVDAVADQVRRVGYVSGMAFTNEAAETLADELAGLALGDLEQFYYASVAPIIVKNHVITGVSGDDLDIPGYIESHDPDTGALQWRWYAHPEPGTPEAKTWPSVEAMMRRKSPTSPGF